MIRAMVVHMLGNQRGSTGSSIQYLISGPLFQNRPKPPNVGNGPVKPSGEVKVRDSSRSVREDFGGAWICAQQAFLFPH